MKTEEFYNCIYADKQISEDLKRKNRLTFCFPEKIRNRKILSIGCGPAVDIEFLIEENEVHGVDISDLALHLAKEKGVITHKIDLEKDKSLPFENDYFDIIIATDVLEHVFYPKELLIRTRDILKNDGFGIVGIPNHFFLEMRLRILRGKGIVLPFHESNEWEYFHIRFFNSSSFEKLIYISGYKIIERYYEEFMVVPKILQILPWRFLLRFHDLFARHFTLRVGKE